MVVSGRKSLWIQEEEIDNSQHKQDQGSIIHIYWEETEDDKFYKFFLQDKI